MWQDFRQHSQKLPVWSPRLFSDSGHFDEKPSGDTSQEIAFVQTQVVTQASGKSGAGLGGTNLWRTSRWYPFVRATNVYWSYHRWERHRGQHQPHTLDVYESVTGLTHVEQYKRDRIEECGPEYKCCVERSIKKAQLRSKMSRSIHS